MCTQSAKASEWHLRVNKQFPTSELRPGHARMKSLPYAGHARSTLACGTNGKRRSSCGPIWHAICIGTSIETWSVAWSILWLPRSQCWGVMRMPRPLETKRAETQSSGGRLSPLGRKPDLEDPNQLVAFGTSGHRGTSLDGTFTEAHVLAITQAICDYRKMQGTTGPLYMGKDTHALSAPAQRTALEVLAANNIETIIQENEGVTPTPVISHAILVHNHTRHAGLADGIVITPSHNPPEDGGFKYNPPNGGPADTEVTRWIEDRANVLLLADNAEIKRTPYEKAIEAASTHQEDFVLPYVLDLKNVVDMGAIRDARLGLGVDPLGGAAVRYWEPI